MSWKILLADAACGIGLAYVSSFAGAILEFASALRVSAPEREVQDAVTPPWVTMLAMTVLLGSMVTLVAGFRAHGPYLGLVSIVIVSACVLATHRWLPGENSAYFKTHIIRAMARRHAMYLRKKDMLRAAKFRDLLGSAGIVVQ